MKTNILMIGWEYPPHITGGLGIACKGLVRALAKRNTNILFLLPRLWGDEEKIENVDLFDVTSKKDKLNKDELKAIESMALYEEKEWRSSAYGIHGENPDTIQSKEFFQKTLSAGEHGGLSGGYSDKIHWEIERYAAWAGAYAKVLDFDAIHCHDWMCFPAGMVAAKASGKPLICHVHATEFDRSGEKVNQQIYDLEREAFHICDKIITVSGFTKKILVERYNVDESKIEAIHNGIEFELSINDIKAVSNNNKSEHVMSEEKLVLFLGRITFQKGPDYFVRAAKKVIENIKNVRFVMAGTGDMYHRMIEMAADLGIGKYFHYTGYLDQEEVSRLYSASDLYVMPSVSEPFGLSPLEAMLHNVPVIISKQSGVSEVIRNCMKVDFWNIDELADSIINVLNNSALHAQLTYQGRDEAKKVTWDEAAEKIENIYNNLALTGQF